MFKAIIKEEIENLRWLIINKQIKINIYKKIYLIVKI